MKVYLALLLLMILGCQRPKGDMAVQDRYDTYTPYPGTEQASERIPPDGVVRRDVIDATEPPLTISAVRNGQKQFNIFCSTCHGRLGNGQGMIVQRGLTTPPSFHIDRLKNAPDQHFYDVITHGFGAMYSYNDRIAPADRWDIVYYVRTLQQSSNNASPEVRAALIAKGDRQQKTGVAQ